MIKALLWDVDGVLITPPKFASDHAIDIYGLKKDKVKLFFDKLWPLCIIDKLKLENCISTMIETSYFNNKSNEYINFWFEYESTLNNNIFEIVSKINERNITQVIASNQERLRTDYLWNELGMKMYFDNIFTSSILKVAKPSSSFFYQILQNLNIKPQEALFIDDDLQNVQSANKIGILSHQYVNLENLHVFLLNNGIVI